MIIYYNNLEKFFQILRWLIASLDMEWPLQIHFVD